MNKVIDGRDLEKILATPNVDIPLQVFFALIGWEWYVPLPLNNGHDGIRKRFAERYEERKAKIPRQQEALERRFVRSVEKSELIDIDYDAIRHLKELIESTGMAINDMGYKGLAHFNEALLEFGIEPIKVGRINNPRYTKKYGLELADDKVPP